MDDIKTCFGPACQAKAAKEIFEKINRSPLKSRATISRCDCLGACDQANNISVNGVMIRQLNEHTVEAVIQDLPKAVETARRNDSERNKKLEAIIDDPFYFTAEGK